jgi:hypothetical protein
MSSPAESETETLLPSSPEEPPTSNTDGGRDVPVSIDAFKRNIFTCKSLLGVGLAGSLAVETWCIIQSFIKHYHGRAGQNLGTFLYWEKVTNVTCVILMVCPSCAPSHKS